MNLKVSIFTIALALFLTFCSDDDRIFNAYRGDRELSEGELVPFILEQNYPNPFNPSTVIRYQVFSAMRLKLKVYSEDWQEVATLFNGFVSGGPSYYSVTFNAESKKLPSGDYFYTLEGGGYIQVRRMMVVK
jgi:hypothetical protein